MTVRDVLRTAVAEFTSAGLRTPLLDAEVLLASVLNAGRTFLHAHPERNLSPEEQSSFRKLVLRRLRKEPVAYLTETKEFFGLSFRVSPAVLIPRPETELVIEEALEVFKAGPKPVRILDMGTGSGALAVVLKTRFPSADVWACDISQEALDCARFNADNLTGPGSVRFVLSDRFSAFKQSSDWVDAGQAESVPVGKFDLIVCNPPYVPEHAVLEPNVKDYEPHLALFAGEDGLSFIRPFLSEAPLHLTHGGTILMECGIETAGRVAEFAAPGLVLAKMRLDPAGIPRLAVLSSSDNTDG